VTDWNLFLVVDAEPVEVSRERSPDTRVVLIGSRRMLALPDNGYQLLLAWVAGPRRVVRTPAPMHPEQDIIDTFVNSYLTDVGVPPRPRGFAWYLDLPVGVAPSDVWGAVAVDVEHGATVDLHQVREAMERGVAALYNTA
jgi:hypothetical protein